MPIIIRVAGQYADRLTLDWEERQALVQLVPPYQQCHWEHHVFFGRLSEARWVAADTAMEAARRPPSLRPRTRQEGASSQP